MMIQKELYIPSTNGKNQLHILMWIPDGAPRAILQLSHGMVEHIRRYEEFATYLANRGILVIGNDHLGHGLSVNNLDELGYFNAPDSSKTVVDDLHQVTLYVKKHYPNIPCFLLGHSMGSFMARRYLMTYGSDLKGAIIMGTGQFPNLLVSIGLYILKFLKKWKGDHYRSQLINQLSFGSYNNQFKPTRTTHDWLSKNTESIDAYLADPYCTFLFTLNGYETLLRTFHFIGDKSNIIKIPKDLPLLFVAGKDDPVGGKGKVVMQIYNLYTSLGLRTTKLKLYEADRHEILNELDYATVFKDIYNWLETYI